MWDISYAFMLMASEVLVELCTLPGFGSELQLHKFFNRLQEFVNSSIMWIHIIYVIQTCFVDGQVSDWRPFIHVHDLTATNHGGVRPTRLPSGRIGCHFQTFNIALSGLLLVCLDSLDFSRQGWEFHFEMRHGDDGSEFVQCFPTNQSKV